MSDQNTDPLLPSAFTVAREDYVLSRRLFLYTPTNQTLSNERAKIVDRQFSSRGVLAGVSTGFGSAVPVASNETDDGREKNRRVEVWLR